MPRRGKKNQVNMLPVAIDELPEAVGALAWAEEVRARAEREIERETTHITEGVMRRVEGEVGRGITQRHADIVRFWNGTGARATMITGGEGDDYYTISKTLEQIALLPALGEDAGVWWTLNACPDREMMDGDRLALHCLYPNHYNAVTETAISLKETLKALLRAMLPAMPDSLATYRIIADRTDGEIRLSKVVMTLNELEDMKDVIEVGDRSYEGKAYDADTVLASLQDGGCDVLVDCGRVRDAQQMSEVVSTFGATARGCKKCDNWFTVEPDNVKYNWYDRCPSCSKHWSPGIFVGRAERKSSEIRLVKGVDRWVSDTIALSPKLAIAENTTLAHATRILGGDLSDAPESRTAELQGCPLAASCETLCGELQRNEERAFPLTPESGRFEDCCLYDFYNMADGVEGDDREQIARKCINNINEMIRRNVDEADDCDQRCTQDPKVANKAVASPARVPSQRKKEEEQEVSVQASLF